MISLIIASATSRQRDCSIFLEEIGLSIYNHAVADAQRNLLKRINELEARVTKADIEVHQEEFQNWLKYDVTTTKVRK